MLKKLTDLEKLLYANAYIEELRKDIKNLNVQNGMLKSEIDELKYAFKKKYPKVVKLEHQKKHIKQLVEKINHLKETNEKLIIKIIKYERLNKNLESRG